jgi:ubiquinone/menaquinone biosynthesis C-methylase UbiE
MTWEETIQYIRTKDEFKDLIKAAYFEEELSLNVERFVKSEEYQETKKNISSFIPIGPSTKLLDIGSGNGISAVAFAIDGVQVDSVEPDPSDTIGAGAIRKLKEQYKLANLSVHQGYAEDLKFPDGSFDIVYARQCMHHANDLSLFIKECGRVLKKGGLLITVRDHVVFDEADKKLFLENHPLQKFYGGENAFTELEYKDAMEQAGLKIEQRFKHFESVINYFPLSSAEKKGNEAKSEVFIDTLIRKKLGPLATVPLLKKMAQQYVKGKLESIYDERKVPGRMYTFLALKK